MTRTKTPMRPDNTAPIIAAARQRHELARAKAIQAIRELDRAGTAVTFTVVAGTSGVSRSWLYSQPDIRDQIQRLRDATSRSAAAPVPPASGPPMPRCCADWRPLTPNGKNSWANASGCCRNETASAGRSPACSASNDRQATPHASRCSKDVQHVPVR